MASKASGPEDASELDDDEPGRERLVTFSSWRATVGPSRTTDHLRHGAGAQLYRLGRQFTPADHATLAAWASDTRHGYDRVEVEQGLLEDGSFASYALVYGPGQPWSTWGLTRRGDHIEMWRCATGKTMARHARMATALAALPHATDQRRALQVLLADEVADPRHPIAHSAPTALAAEDPGDGSDDDTGLDRGRHPGGRRRAGALDRPATDA